jgi:hypothetical protein
MRTEDSKPNEAPVRRPYLKPAFQWERVFETRVMLCKTPGAGNHCSVPANQ